MEIAGARKQCPAFSTLLKVVSKSTTRVFTGIPVMYRCRFAMVKIPSSRSVIDLATPATRGALVSGDVEIAGKFPSEDIPPRIVPRGRRHGAVLESSLGDFAKRGI